MVIGGIEGEAGFSEEEDGFNFAAALAAAPGRTPSVITKFGTTEEPEVPCLSSNSHSLSWELESEGESLGTR